MWTLIMKLPYPEVKFYPEVKSQTSLSSLWVSCNRARSLLDIISIYSIFVSLDYSKSKLNKMIG